MGEEAHIRSRRTSGPRYDSEYDADSIDSYENLILLCPTHHTVVDKDGGRGFSIVELVEMRRAHERATAKDYRLQRVYAAYLADQWLQDNRVLFEAVDLNGPSVDSMFVDVPIAAPASSEAGGIVAAVHAAAPIDFEARDESNEFEIAGGAQVLLSPLWRGNALIQGGPGQGKSTLLQYVCQFHRSRLVSSKDDRYTGTAEGLKELTSVARLPIRVDLRRFAAWLTGPRSPTLHARAGRHGGLARRRGSSSNESPIQPDLLATFIAEHVAINSGLDFSVEDLVTMLVEESVLLALDGLDEIASLKERERVGDIIVTSVPRLQAYALDLMVLVATRPGATDSTRWADANFTLMRLRPLSMGLKVQYLTRWCSQANVPTHRAEDLQKKLIENQSVPHVRELGSNPMQLAILLHLLYRRGLLPQQRTELYREYVKTFLDREEQDKEPLLHKHRQVIIDVHAYLAWYLQSRAETDQNTAGTLTRAELVYQVKKHLASSTESSKFADKLIAALTSRVLCLVERHSGYFEFEVQSLREYFAALHIYEEAPPRGAVNSRDDCLNALLERPYWSNVMRFLVGMLSKGEVKSLVTNLQAGIRDSDAKLDSYLRRVASQFLDDRIYENQADSQISSLVDFVLEGGGVVYAEDGLLDAAGLPLLLSEGAGALQLVEHVKKRLLDPEETTVHPFLASLLLRHSTGDDVQRWAWENVQSDLSLNDLELLASLGALVDLDPSQEARVATATAVNDVSRRNLLDFLVRGRYNGSDSDLLVAILSSVLDGAAEMVGLQRLRGSESALRTIVGLGRLESLSGLRRLNGNSGDVGSPSVHPDGEGFRDDPGAVVDGWRSADREMTGDRGESDWKQFIAALHVAASDSWLHRVVLTYAAQEVDLSLGSDASLSGSDMWRSHAAWALGARERSSDESWWDQNPLPGVGLPRRHWLLCAFVFGSTQVLTKFILRLDEALNEMSADDFAGLEIAVRRLSRRPMTARLNLLGALKRDAIKVGPRTAALLMCRSDQEAAGYLSRLVVSGVLSPAAVNVPARVLQDAIGSPAVTVDVSRLEGTRDFLPEGTVRHVAGKQLTIGLSRRVLRSPQAWPADVVALADRRLALKRASSLPAVAQVAQSDRWFAPD